MALTLLKTVVVKINNWANNCGQKIKDVKHPYLLVLFILVIFGLINFVNSLIRYPSPYQEVTLYFSISWYLGGMLVFFLVFLLWSSILFFILRRKLKQIRFANFYLGILLFTFPTILSALINIFYPILIIHINNKISTYSIFSVAYIFDFKAQNALVKTTLKMLDLLEIIQVIAYSLFFKSVSTLSYFYLVLIVLFIQYIFYLVAA